MDDLDARTLMPFINDNLLLNSVLQEVRIKTSGARLKIIMTLKTLEKNRLGNSALELNYVTNVTTVLNETTASDGVSRYP